MVDAPESVEQLPYLDVPIPGPGVYIRSTQPIALVPDPNFVARLQWLAYGVSPARTVTGVVVVPIGPMGLRP